MTTDTRPCPRSALVQDKPHPEALHVLEHEDVFFVDQDVSLALFESWHEELHVAGERSHERASFEKHTPGVAWTRMVPLGAAIMGMATLGQVVWAGWLGVAVALPLWRVYGARLETHLAKHWREYCAAVLSKRRADVAHLGGMLKAAAQMAHDHHHRMALDVLYHDTKTLAAQHWPADKVQALMVDVAQYYGLAKQHHDDRVAAQEALQATQQRMDKKRLAQREYDMWRDAVVDAYQARDAQEEHLAQPVYYLSTSATSCTTTQVVFWGY